MKYSFHPIVAFPQSLDLKAVGDGIVSYDFAQVKYVEYHIAYTVDSRL